MSIEGRQVGNSGLSVSRLGLGTMTWGADVDPESAAAQLTMFVEAGGSLLDTADVYTDGQSETLLGNLIGGHSGAVIPRESVVIATKAGIAPGGARRRDASRGHLLSALNASLKRLRTDYIDLWQIHTWDDVTPLPETLSAVDAAVSSGKVRYAGISNYAAWQLAATAATQRCAGVSPLVSMQAEYSLLERGVEAHVVPAAAHAGVGLLAWSPLGRGVLTGKYRNGAPPGSRGSSPALKPFVAKYLNDRCAGIVEAVSTAADGLGVLPMAVALAWVRDRPGVTAPIVGARTASQLKVALQAEELILPDEIRTALDDVSAPAKNS